MSESQQGPEICDVISRKRYYYITLISAVTQQLSANLACHVPNAWGGGGDTSYDGLHGEAPPGKGYLFKASGI